MTERSLRYGIAAVVLLLANAAAADPAERRVPLDQAGFQDYMARQAARYAPGDKIVFDTPYMMKIVSPVNRQWVELPLDSVRDECVARPAGCDEAVAEYVAGFDKMLPAAIAARDNRQAHDNSLQIVSTDNPVAKQLVPAAPPGAAVSPIPADKDAFTSYYADALTRALPEYRIAVDGTLRVNIQVPGLGSHVDRLDEVYKLCERDKFKCGDGLSEWLTLDVSEIIRQINAASRQAK
jgi:hypothetical protein